MSSKMVKYYFWVNCPFKIQRQIKIKMTVVKPFMSECFTFQDDLLPSCLCVEKKVVQTKKNFVQTFLNGKMQGC